MDPAAAPRPPRKTSVKRVIAAAVAWLMIGSVVNIAVAWGLSAWLPQVAWTMHRLAAPQPGDRVNVFETTGAARAVWYRGGHRGEEIELFPFPIAEPLLGAPQEAKPVPPWGRIAAMLERPTEFPRNGLDHAAGWPTLCLWYGVSASPKDHRLHLVLHGLVIDDPGPGGIAGFHALPLRPIWPGFALNTLFYAAIAWLLWRIPIFIRRHRRRTRGLCLRCAYNRAGLAPNSPCPECGHTPSPPLSASSA